MKRRTPKKELGKVYLVGAGPGDPGLLTLRAKELLEASEFVLFDHLVHPNILRHCPQARLQYVGKVGHADSYSQKQIEGLLLKAARKYSSCVRLKGGDPFIFGRGGEEAEFLAAKGIPFEVVPGISSAIAVPAYAGIPLTHRKFASSVAFLTGHEEGGVQLRAMKGIDTLVFLMGVKALRGNLKKLVAQGRAASTPAAIIEWGTYPRQRVVQGTLKNLAALSVAAKIQAPAIVVVGDVVRLRERLNWREKLPLFGRRILVTRAPHQADSLVMGLSELGAEAVEFPTLEIRGPDHWEEIDRALTGLSSFDWIFFTSSNAVEWFFKRYRQIIGDLRLLAGIRLGVVGPGTGRLLREMGLMPDRIAQEFSGLGLASAFQAKEIKGKKILIPRSNLADDQTAETLRERGGVVEAPVVYRTLCPAYSQERLGRIFSDRPLHLLTFTSPSAADHLMDLLRNTPFLNPILKVPVAVIGAKTMAAAQSHGFEVRVQPEQQTVPKLIQSILKSLM